MLRINVVGTSGSGKSTIARELSEKLGFPHVELDRLYWEANWTPAPEDVFLERVRNALAGPNWVVDGNYSMINSIKCKNATHLIWLDLPFPATFWQAVKRATGRIISGEEIWPGTGNRETVWRTFFNHDSVLLWTITSYSGVKKKYETMMKDPAYSHIEFIRLKNRKEVRKFMENLGRSVPAD